MDSNEPCAEYVCKVMQDIRVGDTIDGSVGSDREQKNASKEAEVRLNARNHTACAERFDEQDEGHD